MYCVFCDENEVSVGFGDPICDAFGSQTSLVSIFMFRGGVSAIVGPFLLSLYVLTFSLSSLIAMLDQREVPFYN